MLAEKLKEKKIILASKSPRRQELLKGLDIEFEIETKEVEEIYPNHLQREEVAMYLATLKAEPFKNNLSDNTIIITSDTIVCLGHKVLGKPKNSDEAFEMINSLSGNKHTVITGVHLLSVDKAKSFYSATTVYFKSLAEKEINYYIEKFKPYDKAGAYGIQEWIGYIGIEKIEGCYFNVMGLPLNKLYEELNQF